jgi:hypothetical protein
MSRAGVQLWICWLKVSVRHLSRDVKELVEYTSLLFKMSKHGDKD